MRQDQAWVQGYLQWRKTTHTYTLTGLCSSFICNNKKTKDSNQLFNPWGNIFGCTWNGQFVDEDTCYAKGNDKWPKGLEEGQALFEVRDGCLGEAHGNRLSLSTVCLN